MILERVLLSDFLPFEGSQEIVLAPEPSRPVVVVFGDNMRGKTSLLNAIRWCLYGRAFVHTGREIPTDRLLNLEAKAAGRFEFSVTTEFSFGRDKYRLSRRGRPNRFVTVPQRAADFDVSASMTKNGMPIPADQVTQEVSSIAPEETSRFFLFDGELLNQFEALLLEGSDQARLIRDSIERILGVPALVMARDDIRLLQREVMTRLAKDKNQVDTLSATEKRRDELIAKALTLDESIKAYSAVITELDGDIADLEAELDGAERLLTEAADLEQTKRRKREVSEERRDLVTQLLEPRAQVWQDILAAAVEPTLMAIEDEIAGLSSSNSRKAALLQETSRLREDLERERCAYCGQPVNGDARAGVEIRLRDLQTEHESIRVDPDRLSLLHARQRDLRRLRRNGSLERARVLEDRLKRAGLEEVRLDGNISDLEQRIQCQDTESLRSKRNQLVALSGERRQNQDRLDRAITDRDAKEREANLLQDAIERSSASTRFSESSRRREVYGSLSELFADAVETLRAKLRQEVEARASEAFLRMTTQGSYTGLRIRESYGLAIEAEGGIEVPLKSAGAEQVVALSLIDGLHRTGMGGGGVIMDTPFGRLDPKHRANIIRYVTSANHQVVLLVHEGELTRDFIVENIADLVARSLELVHVGPFHTRIAPVDLRRRHA